MEEGAKINQNSFNIGIYWLQDLCSRISVDAPAHNWFQIFEIGFDLHESYYRVNIYYSNIVANKQN